MTKQLLFLILFSGYIGVFAQTTDTASTIITTKGEKLFDHSIGVQVNELIKQVFNFNNSTSTANTNPYLLIYHINTCKNGWGLRVGGGYNYTSTTTDDGINKKTTNINDMQLRLGVEKAFKLHGKWTAGAGIDGLYNTNNDNTIAVTTSFDTVTVNTKTVISSYGAGAMAWLRYSFTKNIIIGTETSFYYIKGTQKITIDVKDSNQFNPTTAPTTTTSDNKIANATISLPVVFYLIVKF